MRPKLNTRRTAAILFSLIIAGLVGLGGLLLGAWLWDRYSVTVRDVDDTAAYFCGLLVGGVLTVCGGVACFWRFWPRVRSVSTESMSASGAAPLKP